MIKLFLNLQKMFSFTYNIINKKQNFTEIPFLSCQIEKTAILTKHFVGKVVENRYSQTMLMRMQTDITVWRETWQYIRKSHFYLYA